jgi:hypothetical protein
MKPGKFRRLYRAPFPKSGPARSEPLKREPEPEPEFNEWPKDRTAELAALGAASLTLRTNKQ